MAGAALIAEDPEPTEEQIKYAIRGNVCRCTGYKKIIEGISLAAAVLRGEKQIDEDLERGDDYGVGKRAFRIDVRKKVLGEGKYPDDIDELDQPGLTYASAVRSSIRAPACSPSIPPDGPCPAWWASCAPRTCRSTRSATLSRTGTS